MILSEHIRQTARMIDAFCDGYMIGTLIVDNDTVSLETKNGEIVLDDSYVIEVFAGVKYHTITYEQALHTVSSDGWSLYAGFECRVKKKIA